LSILALRQVQRLLLSARFLVDGTLIDAWCSMNSFRPKENAGDDGSSGDDPGGRNAEVDFRGTKRSNDTHGSLTDPDARLYRKSAGTGARLCYMGHVLMGNPHELAVDTETARGRVRRAANRGGAGQKADVAREALGFVGDIGGCRCR
jgi:hypothetical protein